MVMVKYEVVEHDGGWAYKVGETFSETFETHDAALSAARAAAEKQEQPGETEGVVYEDRNAVWHAEVSPGDDRPITQVRDAGG